MNFIFGIPEIRMLFEKLNRIAVVVLAGHYEKRKRLRTRSNAFYAVHKKFKNAYAPRFAYIEHTFGF